MPQSSAGCSLSCPARVRSHSDPPARGEHPCCSQTFCGPGYQLDNFTSCTNNIYVLNVDQSRDKGYSCTCKQNAKEFSCIHYLGIAVIRGNLVPPRRAMITLLGRNKRKVGRKRQLGSINHLKSIHLLRIPNKMHVSSLASSNPNRS